MSNTATAEQVPEIEIGGHVELDGYTYVVLDGPYGPELSLIGPIHYELTPLGKEVTAA